MKTDVIFVVDASGSVTTKEFGKMLQFMESIIDDFEIGPNSTRVGVVVYSSQPHDKISLANNFTKEELKAAVRNLNRLGGGTNTAGGINNMRKQCRY